MSDPCSGTYIGLALISLALLISVALNIVLFLLRHKDTKNRADTEELLNPPHYPIESRFEEDDEEHCQQQENPIYGNISSVSEGIFDPVCYEPMTLCRTRENLKQPQAVSQLQQPDLNYASLDLDVRLNCKKKQRRYNQNQSPGSAQTGKGFLEVDTDVEASTPSRNNSPQASRNSIYLNSQQMALENEMRLRERGWDRDRKWDTGEEDTRRDSDGGMEIERDAEEITHNLGLGSSPI
ncbi:hypothetical protein DPEC_G00230220 [Dallia pectoralis]|uniref:Uncharacterized protein n=1 Tax=Dallia pectoralis TaxID=75939 RepID=A0ACC2G1Y5_DALPE|nr:hypothetical protein DPEC_G00230220 [Dallia pectoralis]